MVDNTWAAKIGAAVLVGGTALGGVVAKAAHLGPFADELIRNADVAIMSARAFGDNVSSMRQGTFIEKQAVEVACTFFTSLATTGQPPSEWDSFRGAMAERAGVSSTSSYLSTKVEQLELTVNMAQRQPQAAAKYVEYCV